MLASEILFTYRRYSNDHALASKDDGRPATVQVIRKNFGDVYRIAGATITIDSHPRSEISEG